MQNTQHYISKYWNISLSSILLFLTFTPNLCLAGLNSARKAAKKAAKAAEAAQNNGASGGIGITDDSGLTDMMCTIVELLTGSLGQGVAMIALVALGIGIFLGKLSWPLALATAVGITFIFSAGAIVGWLTTGTAVAC